MCVMGNLVCQAAVEAWKCISYGSGIKAFYAPKRPQFER